MRPRPTLARLRRTPGLGPSRASAASRRPRSKAIELTALAVLLAHATPSRAADCGPSSGLSTCIDADNLWIRPGGGARFAVAPVDTTPAGELSYGFALSYLSRPIGLRVGSPDPAGTVVHAVDNALDASLLFAFGATDRIELTAVAPVTLFQDGAGVGEIVGSNQPLPHGAMRDLRLGAAASLLPRARAGSENGAALALRLDVALPTGKVAAFARDRTVVGVPSLVFDYRFGRVDLAAEAGGRFRGDAELAGATVGSQLFGGLAAAVDVLGARRLTFGAEAFALYTLATQQPPVRLLGTTDTGPPLVPAEWMLTASSAPLFGGDVSFALAGGGAIPFATESALTAPRLRISLAVRYAPAGRDERRPSATLASAAGDAKRSQGAPSFEAAAPSAPASADEARASSASTQPSPVAAPAAPAIRAHEGEPRAPQEKEHR